MEKVALVFVTTDEGDVLLPAIDSVLASPPEHPVDVIVVDNASSDGIGEKLAAKPGVRVLRRDTRYGLPANLNHGVKVTDAPLVMLCNSDLVFAPGAVDALATFLERNPRAGVAAPRLIAPDGTTRPSARRWYTLTTFALLKGPWRRAAADTEIVRRSLYADWDMSSPKRVDWVPCPATMVRRSAFEQVGMMDERFRLYFDDVDLSFKMHEAGWEVWCVPDAEVVHLEQRASVRPMSRAWRWHLASLIKFLVKHRRLKPKG